MKKKEVLIILVLAVLVTGLSWLYCYEISTPVGVGGFGLIQQQVCGWPLWYWYQTEGSLNFLSGFLNLLFWFLVLAAGWWVVKRIKKW